MRVALPNTDQPRIRHSEYRDIWRRRQAMCRPWAWATSSPELFSPQRNLFWPCIALYFDFSGGVFQKKKFVLTPEGGGD